MNNLAYKLPQFREDVERALQQDVANLPGKVGEAVRYSLLGGGKRVRASLALAVCEMLSGASASALPAACSIEMLHCYSLIHDDLPCMDNDDFRRGQPSCHKMFGEATALLAGDCLLTLAFQRLAQIENPDTACRCVAILGRAAGGEGMIYGQELDLFRERVADVCGAEQLRHIDDLKTGQLISAAIQMGAACAGCTGQMVLDALDCYARAIGLVFQIVDDVLDETSSLQELGKPTGSDRANGKVTYASLLGTDGAMQLAAQLTDDAINALAGVPANAEFLCDFAQHLLFRKK